MDQAQQLFKNVQINLDKLIQVISPILHETQSKLQLLLVEPLQPLIQQATFVLDKIILQTSPFIDQMIVIFDPLRSTMIQLQSLLPEFKGYSHTIFPLIQYNVIRFCLYFYSISIHDR